MYLYFLQHLEYLPRHREHEALLLDFMLDEGELLAPDVEDVP